MARSPHPVEIQTQAIKRQMALVSGSRSKLEYPATGAVSPPPRARERDPSTSGRFCGGRRDERESPRAREPEGGDPEVHLELQALKFRVCAARAGGQGEAGFAGVCNNR